MLEFLAKYLIFEFICLLLIIISSIFIGKRYLKKQGSKVPENFEKTEEVNIDPVTNKKIIVYFNKMTGERFYKEE